MNMNVTEEEKEKGLEENKKDKKEIAIKFAFAAVVLFLIAFPYILNEIITYKCYLNFGIASSLNEKDWFAFFGSYLGAVGTIIFGLITFQQTYTIHKQEERMSIQQREIKELHEKITDYQAGPVIYVDELRLKWLNGCSTMTGLTEMQKYYFAAYGKDKQSIKKLIVIMLRIKNLGNIPVIACEIDEINWQIDGKTYKITFTEEKKIVTYAKEVFVLIEDTDKIEAYDDAGKPLENQFFQDMITHFEFKHNGLAGYNRSKLSLLIDFRNAINKKRKYCIYAVADAAGESVEIGRLYSAEAKNGK